MTLKYGCICHFPKTLNDFLFMNQKCLLEEAIKASSLPVLPPLVGFLISIVHRYCDFLVGEERIDRSFVNFSLSCCGSCESLAIMFLAKILLPQKKNFSLIREKI